MKYLLEIEFRYTINKGTDNEEYKAPIIVIGVYNNIDAAIKSGNNELIKLESRYEKNEHYPLSRFSEKKKLISDLAYLKAPFAFFFTLRELNIAENGIDNIFSELKENK